MSDIELDYGSDQEVSANHSKLIEAISKLDKGQRVKKPQRSEPSLEVSEFHLVKSGISDKDAVRIDDLAKTLGAKAHHAEISKKLQATRQKAKVLPKPLEKPAADRLKRVVGFENTKKELQAWNAVVARNRTAETLTFPLSRPSMRVGPTNDFVTRFRLRSDLEKELDALEPPKPVTEEKVDEFPLTLEEIMQKRKEAARFRAQQSYKEAKAYRQNKIKSKKFHRLHRKAKIRQQLKEFEELQKTDPQAALEKLEELDKTRAEERMSLRHKSTGQWAKSKQVRAKYDKDSRQVLAQQLSISKALTQKVRSNEDSDEDCEVSNEVVKPSANDRDNPWVNGVKTSAEIDDFITGYRKYWDGRNKAAKENEDPNGKENSTDLKNSEKSKLSTKPQVTAENPVESVTEEYNESRANVVAAASENAKSKRTIRKACKKVAVIAKDAENVPKVSEQSTKPLSKRIKARIPAKAKKAGTSEWYVEPLNDKSTMEITPHGKSIDIDDLFETMENKIIDRIDSKLKNVKRKLATSDAPRKKRKASKKKKSTEYTNELSFKKKLRPDMDEELNEGTGISGNQAIRKPVSVNENAIVANGNETKTPSQKTNDEIDPNKFINVKPKHLMTMMPDTITGGDDALDDNEEDEDRRNIISEAFADDDVVEEFRKEKAEEIEKSQPEDLDLRLPGWGSWGGKNIAKSMRKKRRFIMKFPKEVARRDENKGDVIIIEEKDPKIREHQVSDLPYPFNSVKDFEASIRAPIGRNFVPENAHKRLIRPAVRTKMGAIIEPMDAEVLLSKKPKPRRRTSGLKKDQKKNDKIEL